MKQRLSFSSTSTFTTCGRKYQLRYIKRYRSKVTSGALLFGSAMDQALNVLLPTRDLTKAIETFDKSFHFGTINDKSHYLPETTLVAYAASDWDEDLLIPEDILKFQQKREELNILLDFSVGDAYKLLMVKKGASGLNSLSDSEKILLNLLNWLCLYRKGLVMLKSYDQKVMPLIKNVLAVQKAIEIENGEGDKLIGYIDMLVELTDGRRVVADNKTSSIQYAPDSPSKSPQLILYYHATKEEYKLNAATFIVMNKQLYKNKTKICSKCQYDGSGERHKTCPQEPLPKQRCGGEWIETIDPECRIDIITNTISEAAESLVMDNFDSANEGIKSGNFGPNLSACDKPFPCEFKSYCWGGSKDDIVELPERKN